MQHSYIRSVIQLFTIVRRQPRGVKLTLMYDNLQRPVHHDRNEWKSLFYPSLPFFNYIRFLNVSSPLPLHEMLVRGPGLFHFIEVANEAVAKWCVTENYCLNCPLHWDRGSTVVKVLRYTSEGHWFDSRLEFFIEIILPIALWPWGRLSL